MVQSNDQGANGRNRRILPHLGTKYHPRRTTHVITFGRQLNKQQKKCRAINVVISDEAKTLHFVGQMYKSDYFTEDQMTQYEMKTDSDKLWDPTLAGVW